MSIAITRGSFVQHSPLLSEPDLDNPADVRAIEDYIVRHEQGSLFHRPGWLKAVEQGTGQKPVYLILRDEENGRLNGLCPAIWVRSPLFGSALVSSAFGVGGGVVADHPAAARMLIEAFWQKALQLGCSSAELRGGMIPDIGRAGPGQASGWQINDSLYSGFVTQLTGEPGDDSEKADQAQLAAIPRKQRAEIRKALNNDLEVRIGCSAQDRLWHYAVYAESVRNLGTPVFPKTLFGAMLDQFGDDADILTVLKDGQPVSSVLSFYHKGTVMPYWGGGIWQARECRGNEMMYYALMNHARRKGCHSFDFGRSKVETGPWKFKKNWGFEPQPLCYALRSPEGKEPRDLNPNSPKYRLMTQAWSKLPLPIANILGPHIAKGLG